MYDGSKKKKGPEKKDSGCIFFNQGLSGKSKRALKGSLNLAGQIHKLPICGRIADGNRGNK